MFFKTQILCGLLLFTVQTAIAAPCSNIFESPNSNTPKGPKQKRSAASADLPELKINKALTPDNLKAQIAEQFYSLKNGTKITFEELSKITKSNKPLPDFIREKHRRTDLINILIYLTKAQSKNANSAAVQKFLNDNFDQADRLLTDCFDGDPLFSGSQKLFEK